MWEHPGLSVSERGGLHSNPRDSHAPPPLLSLRKLIAFNQVRINTETNRSSILILWARAILKGKQGDNHALV